MTLDDTLSLTPVTLNDLTDVESIFGDLDDYSLHVDGVARREGAAHEFVTALPPGYEARDKHSFLAKREGLPVGLLDVVVGYPSSGTAFVGLLAVRESAQGSGVGRALFQEAERFARDNLKARVIRVAVVESNPVIGYWEKMGFRPTGETEFYQREVVTSRVIFMEKKI